MWTTYFPILTGILLTFYCGINATASLRIDRQFPLGVIGKSLSQKGLLLFLSIYGITVLVLYLCLFNEIIIVKLCSLLNYWSNLTHRISCVQICSDKFLVYPSGIDQESLNKRLQKCINLPIKYKIKKTQVSSRRNLKE